MTSRSLQLGLRTATAIAALAAIGLVAVVAGADGRQISERLGPYTGHGDGKAEPGAGGGGAKEAA